MQMRLDEIAKRVRADGRGGGKRKELSPGALQCQAGETGEET